MKVLERDGNYLPKKVKTTIDLEFDISVTVSPPRFHGGTSRVDVSVPGATWSLAQDIEPNDLDASVAIALERFHIFLKDRLNDHVTMSAAPRRPSQGGGISFSALRAPYELESHVSQQELMRRRENEIAARADAALAGRAIRTRPLASYGQPSVESTIAQVLQESHARRLSEAMINGTATTVAGYSPTPLEAAIATGSSLTAELEAAGNDGEDNGALINPDVDDISQW